MSCIIFSLQSEQIRTEFKLLARKHHPDKVSNEEHKAEAEKLFTRIKRAKEVLLDENMRTKYDEWRGGVFKSYWSFDDWLALQSRVHTSMHWATSQRNAPSLPEPETNISHEGKGQGSDDEHSVSKKLKSDSEASSSTTGTHAQDNHSAASKSSLLEEFRKGTEGQSLLSQFRRYQV